MGMKAMLGGWPTDDQLKKTFVAVLGEVLSGQGIRSCTGLDMDTDDALWEIAAHYPEVSLDLVDAARAAFAGQLDGSNAARWHAEIQRKFKDRQEGRRASARGSGPAGPPDTEPSEEPAAAATTARTLRVTGDRTFLDEYGRTCHEGGLLTGEVEERTDTGQIELLSTYFQGVEHGRQQEWWPDGTKRADGVTRLGSPVGEWRYWHANGQLAELVVFDDNGREMTRRRWSTAGELTLDEVTR
ncbi:toxin-antitoxin system YwqK family antitoxin [Streptosporangium nondiastaticum]|uniref:toxin-antitoxin system YwqK family antitoxin n=1 Tax=Streptosporangium nondiastaticum TaxID=35764 RepID=UPI00167576B1|nr:hypothetical protein [Streptosporangium nondiastaticum]